MIEIFAHRAIFDLQENTLQGIKKYMQLNIGLELDLRINKKGVYMSHDKTGQGESFDEACRTLKNSNCKIALHIKELDAVTEIIKIINKHSINNNCFLFDTDYERICSLVRRNVEVAFYASQKPENIRARILWCDEVRAPWYNKETISNLHKENKTLYAVSKELINSHTKSEIISDWDRLLDLGFDGICTNHPIELASYVSKKGDKLH